MTSPREVDLNHPDYPQFIPIISQCYHHVCWLSQHFFMLESLWNHNKSPLRSCVAKACCGREKHRRPSWNLVEWSGFKWKMCVYIYIYNARFFWSIFKSIRAGLKSFQSFNLLSLAENVPTKFTQLPRTASITTIDNHHRAFAQLKGRLNKKLTGNQETIF